MPNDKLQAARNVSRTGQTVSALVAAIVLIGCTSGAAISGGLWVGEITLNKVNETVVGFDASNHIVAPDPTNTTLVASPAHLRVIFHVDTNGVVRLLKSVAVLPKPTTNAVPDVSLVSDPSLYLSFSNSSVGKRISSAAFDFGDANASQVVNQLAASAAAAAATGANPTNAANAVIAGAITNAVNPSPAYVTFIASPAFQSSARIAGAAASSAVQQAPGGSTQAQKQQLANDAALKALINGQIFGAADAVVANEAIMSGNLAAGGILTGSIYLGASHPTNPFRHRRHPDHTIGYAITRALKVQFDAASGTNNFQTAGFGVDRLTGSYREEIFGLHKPLGPLQNVGLITEGTITLDRVSQVATLNR